MNNRILNFEMKLIHLITTILASAILFSCSSDDSDTPAKKTNPIVVNSIESSNKYAFTEDTITITIDAEGYSDIEIISDDDSVIITKVNDTTYSISATEAVNANITFNFSAPDDFTKTEELAVSFYAHGVIDFKIVEGLTIDVDSPEKALALLGEPEAKTIDTDDNEEVWYYFEKGFWILMDMNVNQVHYMRLYGYDFWTRTIDNVEYTGDNYPYNITNDLKIANEQLTMNTIVEKYGEPTEILTNTENTRFAYDYEGLEVLFYFFSDNENNYTNKIVPYINIY